MEERLKDENLVSPCGLYCGECLGFQDGTCGGCISRKGLCLKYSKTCNIYECCVVERKHRFCNECRDFPCGKINTFFDTPEWHDEVVHNLEQISTIGIKQFLSKQVQRVVELLNCAKKNGIKHCSQCKNWPCEKIRRQPLMPA
ncbi:DUF3795 domain-containing protein [Chloroflexota bacterium]